MIRFFLIIISPVQEPFSLGTYQFWYLFYKLTGSLFHKKRNYSRYSILTPVRHFLDLHNECSGVVMGGYREAACSCIKKALRVDSLRLHTILRKSAGKIMMLPGISLPQV